MATKEQRDQINRALVIFAADRADLVQPRNSIATVLLEQAAPEWQPAQMTEGKFSASLNFKDSVQLMLCGFPGNIIVDKENHTVRFITQIPNATYDIMNNLFNTLFTIGDNWRTPAAEQGRVWRAGKEDSESFTTLTFSRIFPDAHQMREPALEVSEYAAALGAISGGRLVLSAVK